MILLLEFSHSSVIPINIIQIIANHTDLLVHVYLNSESHDYVDSR